MKRWVSWVGLLVALVAAGCSDLPDKPVPLPEMSALGEPVPLPEDPLRWFDFWLGEWDVRNKHLSDDGEWRDSGVAAARIQPVAGGTAVLEQWNGAVDGKPLIGFSLRAYDPALDKWVVYLNWHGGEPDGFSAMYGTRRGERLEQFPPGDDTRLRYSFSQAREDSCQWDEAHSEDGRTWINTWVMQFARRDRATAVDATNAPIVAPPASAAEYGTTRALDGLIGAWNGSARIVAADGTEQETAVRVRVTSMIEGFGLLLFADTAEGESSLTALGWDRRAQKWIAVRASNRADGLVRLSGDRVSPRGITLSYLSEDAIREHWLCEGPDRCTWRREKSTGGGDWRLLLEADLTRGISQAAWIEIPNARTPLSDVLTGGQVSQDQLVLAARGGYRTVVNMRGAGEKGRLPDEAERVRELGMEYVAIPITGVDDINVDNARRLSDVLKDPDALPVLVHCASGNRIGALFALKAHGLDAIPAEHALQIGIEAGLTRLEPLVRERLGLPR